MPIGTKVGLGPGNIVFDANPAPLPRGRAHPQFSAHVCCGQTACWIKMPLGTKVGLSPGHIVLHGDPASPRKGHSPQVSAHVYCGQTVARLSYCWALVDFISFISHFWSRTVDWAWLSRQLLGACKNTASYLIVSYRRDAKNAGFNPLLSKVQAPMYGAILRSDHTSINMRCCVTGSLAYS